MTTKKRGLGRGLDSLLASSEAEKSLSEDLNEGEAVQQIELSRIRRGQYQPRRTISPESIEELSKSIAAQGIIQPILVRPQGRNSFEIIAGERRFQAAAKAGLKKVPVIVRHIADQTAMALALIENIQREDLTALEEAYALQRLIAEFVLTHQEAADAIGRSRASVSNLLRLLELTPEVKEMLESGALEMGHARALLPVTGSDQLELATTIANEHLSVRQTEQLVKSYLNPPHDKAKGAAELAAKADPNIRRLQDDLSTQLSTKVMFRHNSKGHGQMVIHYHSLDQLDGILKKIR